jgi:hypothetical protein
MGRPASDRLTPEAIREVCQRTGSKAMLNGSIAGLGSQYVIGLKAVNCNTGDVLAEAQEQALGYGRSALLQTVVELDPNFARACVTLSACYGGLNEPGRAAENARKAYELRARVSEPATAEFQKFSEHRGLVQNDPWGALAHLGVARAYALDAATDPFARDKAYQDFVTLWKDADPDVPILKQAKAEYAKLR